MYIIGKTTEYWILYKNLETIWYFIPLFSSRCLLTGQYISIYQTNNYKNKKEIDLEKNCYLKKCKFNPWILIKLWGIILQTEFDIDSWV